MWPTMSPEVTELVGTPKYSDLTLEGFVARFLVGETFSTRECADITGVSEAGVRYFEDQAMRKLRAGLEGFGLSFEALAPTHRRGEGLPRFARRENLRKYLRDAA